MMVNHLTALKSQNLKEFFWATMRLTFVHKDFFAFYWKNDTTTSGQTRIRGNKLAFGTVGEVRHWQSHWNVGRDDDIFCVPSNEADQTTDFCHAYSPANNTTKFGAIPNGNGYRVNYETVSIP